MFVELKHIVVWGLSRQFEVYLQHTLQNVWDSMYFSVIFTKKQGKSALPKGVPPNDEGEMLEFFFGVVKHI